MGKAFQFLGFAVCAVYGYNTLEHAYFWGVIAIVVGIGFLKEVLR